MKIEIITTPNEELKETGFGTQKACNSVLDSISKMGYVVKLNMCKTLSDLDEIVKRKPDLVILAVKYISIKNESDIWLSEYFAKHEINYSGSSRKALKFDSDKVLAKSHLRKKGIKTADYFTAIPGQYKCETELPLKFPLFLKPLDAANGNGIDDLSLVTNFAEFESKILSLYDSFNLPVLVEEYLDGREYSVAVIKTQYGQLIVSPVEIIPPQSSKGLRILGEQAKKDDSEEMKKIEDNEITSSVKKLAIDAFINLGIRDFGRIDIKTNQSGHCFFMEANLVPGMTSGSSYFPKACEIEHELTYDKVIQLIVEEGISRVPLAMKPIVNASMGDKLIADFLPLAI
jgi:D-alanine-D-alanine ligase